jgi:hypothetical protein
MKYKLSQLMFKKYVNSQYQLPEYNPNGDFDWIMSNSGLPWLQLDITIPHETILNEINNIESLLIEHRDDYGEHYGWKSFCIHGKSYDATREESHYNDDRPYVWTLEAQQGMPQTVEYFARYWPASQFKRVRVMLLEPGGYVSIHQDHAVSKLTAINIAITQPAECKFVMANHGVVPFVPGRAFWLDISNQHTVINNSNQPRWHIIVHQLFDDNFQNMVVNSYKKLYNN